MLIQTQFILSYLKLPCVTCYFYVYDITRLILFFLIFGPLPVAFFVLSKTISKFLLFYHVQCLIMFSTFLSCLVHHYVNAGLIAFTS